MPKVTVYGADWCPLTTNARSLLDEQGVNYSYIDIDKDEKAAKWVRDHNGGKEKKPTIDVDGEVVTEPTNSELQNLLRTKHILG